MKIKIHLKDPDTLYDAISEAVDSDDRGFSDRVLEATRDIRIDDLKEIAAEWFEYGEYVTLELDTEAKTMRVLTVKESK